MVNKTSKSLPQNLHCRGRRKTTINRVGLSLIVTLDINSEQAAAFSTTAPNVSSQNYSRHQVLLPPLTRYLCAQILLSLTCYSIHSRHLFPRLHQPKLLSLIRFHLFLTCSPYCIHSIESNTQPDAHHRSSSLVSQTTDAVPMIY